MHEIHEGVCGSHLEAQTMATKVLRAGYYWLTIQGGCTEFVHKCLKGQEYGTLSHQKLENLHYILSPWPVAK